MQNPAYTLTNNLFVSIPFKLEINYSIIFQSIFYSHKGECVTSKQQATSQPTSHNTTQHNNRVQKCTRLLQMKAKIDLKVDYNAMQPSSCSTHLFCNNRGVIDLESINNNRIIKPSCERVMTQFAHTEWQQFLMRFTE